MPTVKKSRPNEQTIALAVQKHEAMEQSIEQCESDLVQEIREEIFKGSKGSISAYLADKFPGWTSKDFKKFIAIASSNEVKR